MNSVGCDMNSFWVCKMSFFFRISDSNALTM